MQKFESSESHGYRLLIGQLRQWYSRYQEAHRASQSVGNKLLSGEGQRKEWRSNYGRALSFAGMDSRFSSMTEPMSSTCEWLLENEIFTRWLQAGHGILWILGHPGTGKSTL
jgi:hypothetical protein